MLEHSKKRRSRRGQGITEYACIIAFVAILVTLVFTVTQGKLALALSAAFSAVAQQVINLSSYAS